MKYYVCRQHKRTGRKEYKRTKCTDAWCSIGYIEKHPGNVWQFSKQGAQGIADREGKLYGGYFDYSIVPVADILGEAGA